MCSQFFSSQSPHNQCYESFIDENKTKREIVNYVRTNTGINKFECQIMSIEDNEVQLIKFTGMTFVCSVQMFIKRDGRIGKKILI